MGGWHGRWVMATTAAEAGRWAEALVVRGIVDVQVWTTWPGRGEADVVICLGDPPDIGEPTGPLVVDLPHVVAEGATPAAVAEYLLMRVRAAEAERQLARLRREQFDAVAGFTHDLKNKVAVLRANDAFVAEAAGDDADVVQALADTRAAVLELESLAGDLRLAAELELGRSPPSTSRVHLAAVLGSLREAWAGVAASRRVTVDLEVGGDPCVSGAPAELRTLFDRLIGARVRSLHGGTLALRATIEDGAVVVTLADDGAAPLAAERGGAFDKTELGLARGRALGARGVSLYLARLIAESHGGSVRLIDQPPHDVCIRVVLPAATRAAISSSFDTC
jgi:signal transduction histidine kinase